LGRQFVNHLTEISSVLLHDDGVSRVRLDTTRADDMYTLHFRSECDADTCTYLGASVPLATEVNTLVVEASPQGLWLRSVGNAVLNPPIQLAKSQSYTDSTVETHAGGQTWFAHFPRDSTCPDSVLLQEEGYDCNSIVVTADPPDPRVEGRLWLVGGPGLAGVDAAWSGGVWAIETWGPAVDEDTDLNSDFEVGPGADQASPTSR
jgi:hypothetical protein